MNAATLIGIVTGFVVLALATFVSTSDPGVFVNLPGLAIVLGGTAAATFICYPLKEVARVFSVFLLALGREELPTAAYINELVEIARVASARGKVHLEKQLPGLENDFLRQAVQMLVDGYGRDEIQEILETRISQHYEQEMSAASIYRTMAKLAPAFGIIGTLIGLIGMMQALGAGSEAGMAALGPAMATALTTTLYGVLLANLICLPIAVKVEKRIEERVVLMSVIRDGVLFIHDRAPAAIVLDKLKAYLPPRRWSSISKAPKNGARSGAGSAPVR